jgi:hypothetical protein
MYRKYRFLVLFFTVFVSIIQATPDRHRYVVDRLIGLNGHNIIVHQYVYDNLQSHSNNLIEEYIIEKFMENGNTTIIKQIKLTDQNEIENILMNEYNGNINYIFPDIKFYYYDIQPNIYEGYIEMRDEMSTRFILKEHIPQELVNCRIMRIVDIYYINKYIYLTIDLDDNINTYRKVIMINYP